MVLSSRNVVSMWPRIALLKSSLPTLKVRAVCQK